MNRRMLAVHAVALSVIWGQAIYKIWDANGLFTWIGIDYAMYSVGANLIQTDRPWDVFDLDVTAGLMGPYDAYAHKPAPNAGPAPHHAVTFLTFAPFSTLEPIPGYSLWLLANGLLAVWIVRRLDARFTEPSWARTLLMLTYFPIVYTLYVGQPIMLMLLGFAQAYSAWERRREFEAGLWLGLLFLKPQYPAVLLLVLLWKGRWRSLAGTLVTGASFLAVTLAVYGLRGTAAWLESIRSLSSIREVHQLICPWQMISLRGLVAGLMPPTASDDQAKVITYALTAVVLGALPLIWRRPWNTADPRFASRMLGTMLVTMLVVFHNHIHGASLLVVPAVVVMARREGSRVVRALIVAGLYGPTVLFGTTYRAEWVAILLIGLMLATLIAIVASELAEQDCHGDEEESPGSASRRPPAATPCAGLGTRL